MNGRSSSVELPAVTGEGAVDDVVSLGDALGGHGVMVPVEALADGSCEGMSFPTRCLNVAVDCKKHVSERHTGNGVQNAGGKGKPAVRQEVFRRCAKFDA